MLRRFAASVDATVRAQAYTECSPSTALKAAQESGSMLGIGIVLGDLLSQGFQVGFDLGVPFVLVKINFVYGGKPEQRSRFNDYFTPMPNVVSEDTRFVAALEFGNLRQLAVIEKAPQFHQYFSLRDAEKGCLRVVLAQGVNEAVNGGVYVFPALFELLETFIRIACTGRHDEK
jgi:hypothetical protein